MDEVAEKRGGFVGVIFGERRVGFVAVAGERASGRKT